MLGFFFIVLAINLMPVFAPPTWAIILLFKLNYDARVLELVLIGAIASTIGRIVLALATRKLSRFIPIDTRENLYVGGAYLESRMHFKWLWFILFLISPLPSAQLFEAAGLLSLNLRRLAAAFFLGRLVTYSIYGYGAARLKSSSLGGLITSNLRSPWGILLQVLLLVVIYLLTRIDWKEKVRKKESHDS